uniref:Zinc metalloproteinase n=1 Tax=Globodera pallida TaxID=36090 RepID=A0A183CLU6_GLOPA
MPPPPRPMLRLPPAAICLFLFGLSLGSPKKHRRLNSSRWRRQSALTGVQFPQNRWDSKGPIAFFFDESLSEKTRQVIRAAAEFWQNYTCVNFEENGQMPPRVRFYRGDGCFSEIGKDISQRGIILFQNVSIGDNCGFFAPVAHEIGHVLGMIHTHARSDRDEFIAIHSENEPDGMEKDFERMSPDNSTNLGVEYDYGSVMQYTGYNQQNGKVIMEAKQPHYQHTMGNAYGPVFSDLLAVNRYFGCGTEPNVFIRVTSAECVCANAFGGTDCSEKAPGEGGAPFACGETVQANAQWQTLRGAVEAKADGQLRPAGCHFHVTAPPGQRIELRVEELSGLCSPECNVGALELKFERMTSSGARMCCKSHISEMGILTTEGPLATASVYSQKGKRTFILSHRTVSPSDAPLYTKWSVSAPPVNESFFYPSPPPEHPPGECFDWSPNCASNKNACAADRHRANMAKLCRKTCGLCSGESTFGFETTTPEGVKDGNCADLAAGCARIGYLCESGSRARGMAILCKKTCGGCNGAEIRRK